MERVAIGHNFCTVAASLQTTSEDFCCLKTFLVSTLISGHSYLTVVLVFRTCHRVFVVLAVIFLRLYLGHVKLFYDDDDDDADDDDDDDDDDEKR